MDKNHKKKTVESQPLKKRTIDAFLSKRNQGVMLSESEEEFDYSSEYHPIKNKKRRLELVENKSSSTSSSAQNSMDEDDEMASQAANLKNKKTIKKRKRNKPKVKEKEENITKSQFKKKKHLQYFKVDWKNQFSGLDRSNLGQTYYHCTVCSKHFSCAQAGIPSIKRHDIAMSHKANVRGRNKNSVELFKKCKEQFSISNQTRIIEIQAALFILEKKFTHCSQ